VAKRSLQVYCWERIVSNKVLEIDGLTAGYGGLPIIKDVSVHRDHGEIVGVIGPSGSGKSSLLRAIAGLLRYESGTVQVCGTSVDFKDPKSLFLARSRLAIVFQHFNLFANMTVLRNVSLAPIVVKKWPENEVLDYSRSLLQRVGLGDKVDAYPDELSGGQQQRVAIARALALKPDILLLDEVTSALDPELVNEVLDTIRALAGEGIAMLIVSHEMEFIREICSRVVMFDSGEIISSGSSERFFAQPSTPRVAQFLSRFIRTSRRLD